MNRRTFLRLSAAAGVAIATTPRWLVGAKAATNAYPGPYWLTIHASGGWDPTLLCDPKGRLSDNQTDPVNRSYYQSDVVQVGPFQVAPIDGNQAFFQRFQNDLLVINGIDTQTNSHETGTRHVWSGSTHVGFPSLAALVAASTLDRPSMSYVTQGGYDLTDGLVSSTRLTNSTTVNSLAYPNRYNPNSPDTNHFTEATIARMREAQSARLARLRAAAGLPREAHAMDALAEARLGDNELSQLAAMLPGDLDDSNNPLLRQAQIAMACFKAGVSVSCSMGLGGFDTHSRHDNDHTPRVQQLIAGIAYAMDEAERQGIADKLIVVVGSDFARTPWYNDGNGKDHWSITSMMLMGPGITGGRVVGSTDYYQVPNNLGALPSGLNGERITPAHVHASLRALAGVNDWAPASRYPVGQPLPGLLTG